MHDFLLDLGHVLLCHLGLELRFLTLLLHQRPLRKEVILLDLLHPCLCTLEVFDLTLPLLISQFDSLTLFTLRAVVPPGSAEASISL